MESGPRKRRRTDGDEHRPSVSRKLSSISTPSKDIRLDDQYRRQLYGVSVRDALRKNLEGDSSAYEQIVRKFSSSSALTDAASVQELHLLIGSLSHVVSQLDRRHSPLVQAILSCQWAAAGSSFVKSYVTFMGLLLSAQSQYGSIVLEKIVQGFSHQIDMTSWRNVVSDSSDPPVTRNIIYDRHHTLLEHILSIVPTLTKPLQAILVRRFPHKRLEKIHHVTYIRNVLRVARYCPGLEDHILNAVVERAMQIDVEIQIDLDELEDDGENLDTVFDLDDDNLGVEPPQDGADDLDNEEEDRFSDLSSEDELDPDDEQAVKEAPRDTAHVRDMASKLDAILTILLDHLRFRHTSDPPLRLGTSTTTTPSTTLSTDPDSAARLFALQHTQFRSLLFTFERTIIRTFKSRYTQFLLFWFTSLHADFADEFLGTLIHKVIAPSEPVTIRAAAASYLASFVSRARFVDGDNVRRVFRLLCTYLSREVELYNEQKEAVHISHFTPFFAVSQAVFLMFCFRWRDLQAQAELDGQVDDDADDDELGLGTSGAQERAGWIAEVDVLRQIILSPLNPLKFCDAVVAEQFSSVAAKTNFVFCYTILEQNRRNSYAGIAPTYVLPPASSLSTFPSRSSSSLRPAAARSNASLLTPSTLTSSVTSLSGSHSVFVASNPNAHAIGVAPSSSKDSSAATIAELNHIFPFDPYELPLSRAYIDPVYRVWDEVKIGGDDDDDEDENGSSDAASESEDDDDDDGAASPASLSDGEKRGIPMPVVLGHVPGAGESAEELGKSLGGMSISPVRRVPELSQSFIAMAA